MSKKIQPAHTNYFFKQSYVDLKDILVLTWKKNFSKAAGHFGAIGDGFSENGLWLGLLFMLFHIFAMVSMFGFGTALCAGISLLHISLLMSFTFVVYAITFTLRFFEWIYINVQGIFGACPHCKSHYKIPVYICDCNAKHDYLVPGKYGIFRRTCNCGRKMPTSVLFGRSKLTAECPACHRRLDNAVGEQEVTSICVPVIGGKSVGKTTYIASIMKQLFEMAPKTKVELKYFDANNQALCDHMISLYNSGAAQDVTYDLNPSAYNIFAKSPNHKVTRLLYFYDMAGEVFTTTNALTPHKEFEYAKGFIFVIDPLAIPRIKQQFSEQPEFKEYRASELDINEILDSFMTNLSKLTGLAPNQLSKISCAVVINKIDAFGLSDQIGEKAIAAAMDASPNKDFGVVMDETVREFLKKNGMTNFMKNLETKFKNIRFFAVSSLGHSPNGTKFTSSMVMAPFEWIISHDAVMKELFDEYKKATK